MQCSNCGKNISYVGNVCPYCHTDKSRDKKFHNRILIVSAALLFVLYLAYLGCKNNTVSDIGEKADVEEITLSLSRMKDKDFDGAMQSAQDAVKRYPKNPYAYFIRGQASLFKATKDSPRIDAAGLAGLLEAKKDFETASASFNNKEMLDACRNTIQRIDEILTKTR